MSKAVQMTDKNFVRVALGGLYSDRVDIKRKNTRLPRLGEEPEVVS